MAEDVHAARAEAVGGEVVRGDAALGDQVAGVGALGERGDDLDQGGGDGAADGEAFLLGVARDMLARGEEDGVVPGVEGVGEGAAGGGDELGAARVEQRGDRQLEVGQVAGGEQGVELLAGAPDVRPGDDQAGAVAPGQVVAAQRRAGGDPGARAEPGGGGAVEEALAFGLGESARRGRRLPGRARWRR